MALEATTMSETTRFDAPHSGTRYPPPRKIHYPESDGLPFAETRFQYDSLTYAAGALEVWFRDRRDVAVEGRRILYYVEGEPRFRVSPGRVRGHRRAEAPAPHLPDLGGTEGSGLRAGGDLEEHPVGRSRLQAGSLRASRGERVLAIRSDRRLARPAPAREPARGRRVRAACADRNRGRRTGAAECGPRARCLRRR